MLKHGDIISALTPRQKADLLTGRDFWSTQAIENIGLPSAVLSDGPHGVRRQKDKGDSWGLNPSYPATCFPTAAAMACSWNAELCQELGAALGQEAAAQGVNALLGPGLNIKRDPRCGRNFEYFSEDPYLSGKIAAAYVRGIQSNGIAACVKHFALNNQEERRTAIDSVADERTLREIYLTGFEIAIKEGGARAVMSAYNRVNGSYASENAHLLKDILRDEWEYDGIVVTDWAGGNNRVKGVKCGCNLEMPRCRHSADDVYEALSNGSLSAKAVDECLDGLIDFVLSTDKAVKGAAKSFDVDGHHSLAQKCAEESVVLLKNDGALPLKNEEKLCIIGDFAAKPRYQGAGSSAVNCTRLDDFLSCAKAAGLSFTYAEGYDRGGKNKKGLERKALESAARADKVILFAGLDDTAESEGLDRENISLPQNQLGLLAKLCKTGKKVVVVLRCGGAVEAGALGAANAVVHGFLGGQAGAAAMLSALTGRINPSGKLAESLPVRYEDCPTANYFHADGDRAEYREGLFVGYRYYLTAGVKTAYPFGYGLSYTDFAYSDLSIDEGGAEFTLKNTGKVDGAEVAQLYVGKAGSAVPRPLRELKGFIKVFLRAGEEKRVKIPFDDKTFRYFNVDLNSWAVEDGEYRIEVGASSADIRLSGDMRVSGAIVKSERGALSSPYFSGDIRGVKDGEFEWLLGRALPVKENKFYKKNRMIIGENNTVQELRYSRRWVGRLVFRGVSLAIAFLRVTGNKAQANTLTMGAMGLPMRGLAQYCGFTRRKMEAMIMMFNGHLFKGLGRFITKGK